MSPSPPLEPLDLHFQGIDRAIGAWLVDTADGPALVDCGPASTLPALEAALAERGLGLADLRHLLITHIHFDHAGAAGAIVSRAPHVQVHVSSVGAPHLAAPERLERSARRLYGAAFDQLWGSLTPVPEGNLRSLDMGGANDDSRAAGLRWLPALGHAKHHVAFLDEDGVLFCGDAAGVRIQPHQLVWPVAPPPDVDVAAWHSTTARFRALEPSALAPTHFGLATDVTRHLDDLEARLDEWAAWIRRDPPPTQASFTRGILEALAQAEGDEAVPVYEGAGPAYLSFLGLERWASQQDPPQT